MITRHDTEGHCLANPHLLIPNVKHLWPKDCPKACLRAPSFVGRGVEGWRRGKKDRANYDLQKDEGGQEGKGKEH